MKLSQPITIYSGDVPLWTSQFGNGKPIVFAHGLLGCHKAIEKELAPLGVCPSNIISIN